VANPAVIEFYKLAAGIIPVLWLGTVLQRLDPSPTTRSMRSLDHAEDRLRAEARRLHDQAEKLRAQQPDNPFDPHYHDAVQAWSRAAEVETKADQLVVSWLSGSLKIQRWAPYALLALLLAAVSEALALYGVAANNTGWAITVFVCAGLVAGAGLLLVPLSIAWLRSWRWVRGGESDDD